jgi:hypothetical protein
LTGSVHLPKRLATWRFHGEQLSLERDNNRLSAMKKMCEDILPVIRQRYQGLLTEPDCELLLLPYQASLANSLIGRFGYWLQGVGRLLLMFARKPFAMLRVLCRAGIGKNFPIAAILQGTKLVPRDLDSAT